MNVPSQRKPLTGRLTIRIHSVAEVDHAATGRFSRGPETFVIVKVEDNFKARTRGTKNGKWPDEVHDIDIDKANEIELTVYDRTGDTAMPIAMLWIRISDIVEEMRRKKIETEFNSSGWVAANQMSDSGIRPDIQFQPPPGQMPQGQRPGQMPQGQRPGPPPPNAAAQAGPIFITAWFALEPVGRIQLTLGFSMSNLTYCCANNTSQAEQRKDGLRQQTRPPRRRPPAKGRSARAVWPQVRPAAVLQHHALRSVRGTAQERGRHAMRRLQVYLPQGLLQESRHQVHHAVQ
jgi:classical protein kinase C